MLTNNKVWIWDNNKETNTYNIQKIFIHTIVDLINTLFEANLGDNKNYLYELIVNRIKQKIKIVYNDKKLIESIDKNIKKYINVKDGKYSFTTKKEQVIKISDIDEENIFKNNKDKNCDTTLFKISKKKNKIKESIYNSLTNCEDGKFHNFIYNKDINDLVCNLCNKKYNDIIKEIGSKNLKNNDNYFKLLKISYLKKLSEKYCISGDIHDFNENNICTKCKYIK